MVSSDPLVFGLFPLILYHLSHPTSLSCWCVGVIWYCRWTGNSDGLPWSHVGPHSAARVGWHHRHVLELSQFSGGGQQWEWHGLWRLLSTTKWVVIYIWGEKKHWSHHIQVVCGLFPNHLVTLEIRMMMIISKSNRSVWLVNSLLFSSPWMECGHTCA